MKKRFTEEQIIGFLREADRGVGVKELEAENARLKQLLAETMLENEVTKEALRKMVTAPAKRELVRWMVTRGLSERRCLGVVGMSASALRYEPRPDQNVALRAQIVALAQRHRRYGVGMIYLKLRQAAELVNYKRVERLYRLEQLHIRRRRRKKLIAAERHPLLRPALANEVWSMDFVFDRVATGRTLKCLTVVDDATHEVIAVPVEHSIDGEHLTRVLDAVCSLRGKPQVIRTDNGPEVTG